MGLTLVSEVSEQGLRRYRIAGEVRAKASGKASIG